MCQRIQDGGRRCPVHRHATKAFMEAVKERYTELNTHQIERLVSELRREGQTSNISHPVFASIRTMFSASCTDLSEDQRERINAQLALSELHDEGIDSQTIYALATLNARAHERQRALVELYESTANRTGRTVAEVKEKFWEEYAKVNTSRGAEAPPEYNQNTRRSAVQNNLPYDRASVTAIEKLKELAPSNLRERVVLTDTLHPSGAISRYGYHEGRVELVFRSNPDRVYAYRNVTEEQWETLRNSTRLGRDWRFLSAGEHAYPSEEAAEADSQAYRCEGCGQFRSATSHSCPNPVQSTSRMVDFSQVEGSYVSAECDKCGADTSEGHECIYNKELTEEQLEALRAELLDEPAKPVFTPPTTLALPNMKAVRPSVRRLEGNDLIIDEDLAHLVYDSERLNLGSAYADPIERAVFGNRNSLKQTILVPSDGNVLYALRSEAHIEHLTFRGQDLKMEVENTFQSNVSEGSNRSYIEMVLEGPASEIDNNTVTKIVAVYHEAHVESNLRGHYLYNFHITSLPLSDTSKRPAYYSRSEEEAREYDDDMNAVNEELINSGELVVLQPGARGGYLSAGYGPETGYMDSPTSLVMIPEAQELQDVYSQGKAVLSNISINVAPRPGELRDNVLYSNDGTRGEVRGDVVTRMTPEGVVEMVSSNLKCSCPEYAEKYACLHIHMAKTDLPAVFQKRVYTGSESLGPLGIKEIEDGSTVSRSANNIISIRPDDSLDYSIYSVTAHATRENSDLYHNEKIEEVRDILERGAPYSDEEKQLLYRFQSQAEDQTQYVNVSLATSDHQILKAVGDSNVRLPVVLKYGQAYVQGEVVYGVGSTPENPIVLEKTLRCNCIRYRSTYYCEHISNAGDHLGAVLSYSKENEREDDVAAQTELVRLGTQYQINRSQILTLSGMIEDDDDLDHEAEKDIRSIMYSTNTTRDEAEAIKQQRSQDAADALQRRRDEEKEKYKSYIAYSESRLAAWETVDPGLLSEDIEAFNAENERIKARRRRGTDVLKFKPEGDVTDGICAPGEGTRSFGVELEFDIKPGVDRYTALENIGVDLYEAGLTQTEEQEHYHSSNGDWSTWSFEEDSTVAGEIVSPIMKDTPEHWAQLRQVVEIITRHGGVASTNSGSHVNISSGSFLNSSAKHAALQRTMIDNSETLFRMASNPHRGSHRGNEWCNPNIVRPGDDIPQDEKGGRSTSFGRHGDMVNMDASSQEEEDGGSREHEKSRIEFRLWDGTLDAAVIQQQVAVSAALTDLAEREVMKDGGIFKATRISPQEDDSTAAGLLDRLFRRAEDRKQAQTLFAITNPV